MIKAEQFSLKKLSEEDILSLERACKQELVNRDLSKFPYKIGDCFCDPVKGSSGKGWMVARVTSLDKGVSFDFISIDACFNRSKFSTTYGYKHFVEEFKTPIDPSIFDVFAENSKAIMELKSEFMNTMLKLRKK